MEHKALSMGHWEISNDHTYEGRLRGHVSKLEPEEFTSKSNLGTYLRHQS